jgi:RNA polymerase sigma-70 factor (ECF subfamily)
VTVTTAVTPAADPSLRGPKDETPASFAELYRETVHDVYAYVATLVGDRAAAEDVVAQAYERAYRKRGSYDERRGTARAWLFGIARNAALDELRRRRRVAALPDEQTADLPAGPAGDDPETIARRATVRAALARLEPRDREVIALKYNGDLTNAEIAKLLGVSESNAGTRLHRAMTKLREACDA